MEMGTYRIVREFFYIYAITNVANARPSPLQWFDGFGIIINPQLHACHSRNQFFVLCYTFSHFFLHHKCSFKENRGWWKIFV